MLATVVETPSGVKMIALCFSAFLFAERELVIIDFWLLNARQENHTNFGTKAADVLDKF